MFTFIQAQFRKQLMFKSTYYPESVARFFDRRWITSFHQFVESTQIQLNKYFCSRKHLQTLKVRLRITASWRGANSAGANRESPKAPNPFGGRWITPLTYANRLEEPQCTLFRDSKTNSEIIHSAARDTCEWFLRYEQHKKGVWRKIARTFSWNWRFIESHRHTNSNNGHYVKCFNSPLSV